MNIQTLRKKLSNPKLFGVIPGAPKGTFDQTRGVIVQVYRGEKEISPGFSVPWYEYHEIRAVGTLFYDGQFQAVIAVGEDG